MSGEERPPPNSDNVPVPVLAPDAATTAAILQLVADQLQAALENLNKDAPAAPGIPGENEDVNLGGDVLAEEPDSAGAEGRQPAQQQQSASAPGAPGRQPVQPKIGTDDAGNTAPLGGPDVGEEPDNGDEEGEQGLVLEPDDDHQPLTENWYEARRGHHIPT